MATVQDVLDRAREVLNDPSKVRWTDAKLFPWVGDALDLLVRLSPGLFTKRGTHTTTAGALQTLALARATAIVRPVGLTRFDKAALDAFSPDWQSGSAALAKQWAPGESPLSFYLYPPQDVGTSIPVDYVQAPAEFTALSDVLPVSDDYVGPLADYVIGMAEAKDATHVDTGRAQAFMQAFASKLGVKPAQ